MKSLFLIIGRLNVYLFSPGSLRPDLKERCVASQGFPVLISPGFRWTNMSVYTGAS